MYNYMCFPTVLQLLSIVQSYMFAKAFIYLNL